MIQSTQYVSNLVPPILTLSRRDVVDGVGVLAHTRVHENLVIRETGRFALWIVPLWLRLHKRTLFLILPASCQGVAKLAVSNARAAFVPHQASNACKEKYHVTLHDTPSQEVIGTAPQSKD